MASVHYRVHRQTYGWENKWAKDGQVSGTVGQAKRLEGITITVDNPKYSGGIRYKTHVQSFGWMNWAENGELSGTYGRAKRLEAIQIELTGEMKIIMIFIIACMHSLLDGLDGQKWGVIRNCRVCEAFRGNTNFACSKRWKCPFQ